MADPTEDPWADAEQRLDEAENLSQLMTPQEVARFFNVSRWTVSQWANSGKLPGFRLTDPTTGHWRFRREDVLKLLHHPTPEPRPVGRTKRFHPQ